MQSFTTLFSQTTSGDAAAGAIGFLFLIFWVALLAVGLAGFVLWIISLIHVLQHNDVKDRTMWILIILLAGTIGGVIYFFAIKKAYDKGGARELPPATS